MADSAPPAAEPPILGVGGRSIELSLGRGVSPDPNAFELAVDELHDQLVSRALPAADLRDAGQWLAALPNYADMPAEPVRNFVMTWTLAE